MRHNLFLFQCLLYCITDAFSLSTVRWEYRKRGDIIQATKVHYSSPFLKNTFSSRISLHSKKEKDDSDSDEEDEIDLSDRDWRAFRAKLVMASSSTASPDTSSKAESEKLDGDSSALFEDDLDGIGSIFQSSTSTYTNQAPSLQLTDPSNWAYDSGKVIEQGAVILGGVEQDFGFGLRQQYFHKAVMLVLEHDESKFTRGIILNRPTDILVRDDMNEGVRWKIWFGGDVQGLKLQPRATSLTSTNTLATIASIEAMVNAAGNDEGIGLSSGFRIPMPPIEIVCLHSLGNGSEEVNKVSVQVLRDIQWTTFKQAKLLVKKGLAKPSDFWVFAGYAGWGPGQLSSELDRNSWYMCSTDSQTLLKELAKQGALCDPRDAGIDTWELLMKMIGRGETVEDSSETFDDLILKEWVRENLITSVGQVTDNRPFNPFNLGLGSSISSKVVNVGSIVRASSDERSPFLLNKQEFHKALVLIINDDENISVGVMLNRPSTKSLEMALVDRVTGEKRVVSLPIRFGGEYAIKGQTSTVLWLHNSPKLKALSIGSPVDAGIDRSDDNGVLWKCNQEDATTAISKGYATPFDFILISGVCVWTKGDGGVARGIQGEVNIGRFELVQKDNTNEIWDRLRKQQVLTKLNILMNLSIASEAWSLGSKSDILRRERPKEDVLTTGIGEGYDEDDDTFVHKTDVRVAKLSDDALQSWIATFLLGSPSLGA